MKLQKITKFPNTSFLKSTKQSNQEYSVTNFTWNVDKINHHSYFLVFQLKLAERFRGRVIISHKTTFIKKSRVKVKHKFHFSVLLFVRRIQQVIVLFPIQEYFPQYFFRTVPDVSCNAVGEFQRVSHFAGISFVVQIQVTCKQFFWWWNSNAPVARTYLW